MVKSKSKIEKQLKKKLNPEVVKTILKTKKNSSWIEVSRILSRPKKQWINKNLFEINEKIGKSKKVVIPGKVLSQGEIPKETVVIAMNFSEKAKEKLLNNGCEVKTILEEIKSNPSGEGIKILK